MIYLSWRTFLLVFLYANILRGMHDPDPDHARKSFYKKTRPEFTYQILDFLPYVASQEYPPLPNKTSNKMLNKAHAKKVLLAVHTAQSVSKGMHAWFSEKRLLPILITINEKYQLDQLGLNFSSLRPDSLSVDIATLLPRAAIYGLLQLHATQKKDPSEDSISDALELEDQDAPVPALPIDLLKGFVENKYYKPEQLNDYIKEQDILCDPSEPLIHNNSLKQQAEKLFAMLQPRLLPPYGTNKLTTAGQDPTKIVDLLAVFFHGYSDNALQNLIDNPFERRIASFETNSMSPHSNYKDFLKDVSQLTILKQ